jgi:tRNA dimethylallyltransferase
MAKSKVIIVAGPTASGKSDLAIGLARRFDGEIISADSRQVYRGMDIGTGKVKRDKQKVKRRTKSYHSRGIRHWLIDVASPKRQYSVAQWKKAAQKAIADIVRRGKLPIICGGTGFWIDTLVYDRSLPHVRPNAKIRARLQKLSPAQLFTRLQKLDPERAATIDRHNPVRLIRALEIVMVTGKAVPTQTNGSRSEPLYLGISMPQEKLSRRIVKRLDARLSHDMPAEVRRLHASGVSWKKLEAFGLEYRWLARFLRGFLRGSTSEKERLSLELMRDGLLHDIIAYSKRQMTWLRRNPDIVWITSQNHAQRLMRQFLSE